MPSKLIGLPTQLTYIGVLSVVKQDGAISLLSLATLMSQTAFSYSNGFLLGHCPYSYPLFYILPMMDLFLRMSSKRLQKY